ncbi:hypothetical protein AMATHDRAFT_1038 [Amanita thiersii Skay4041]|uniref:Uncharacterized protein n=1 Tax=Amanita thiersii Skay4041 TaxID=703135 RepID=A0A2A9P0D6_9AGAR|nr:hypothetical protein AMATHDRAFT_1038 [Amanita thiersii Skay4041]
MRFALAKISSLVLFLNVVALASPANEPRKGLDCPSDSCVEDKPPCTKPSCDKPCLPPACAMAGTVDSGTGMATDKTVGGRGGRVGTSRNMD